MSNPRVEVGLMPKDVMPASDMERYARAEKLTRDLRRLALNDGHEAMVMGQILHDVRRQGLWRDMAETWQEYVNDLGLSAGTEFQRRRNFEVYVLEFGLDITDARLSEAPGSKLAIGTRSKFKGWVRENLDEFLDYARLPLGEGGLTRRDLNKFIEEEVGIGDEDEDSMTRRALRSFRRGVVHYNQLADDSWSVFLQAVRNDESLFESLSFIVEKAGALEVMREPEFEVVDLDELEAEDEAG